MNKKNVYAVKFQHKEHQNEKLEPWIIAPSVVDAILNANKWIGKKEKEYEMKSVVLEGIVDYQSGEQK